MAWYGVSILSKLEYDNNGQISGGGCEETIVLINSLTKEKAIQKALSIGKQEEHSYKNDQGEVCNWIFMGLGGIYEIIDEKIGHKCEIFSRFIEHETALNLLK